ncbi:MAG: hydrogenase 4 subunit F [Candidatus Firestonebacteria bacterium]
MEIILLLITLLITGTISFYAKKAKLSGLITLWGQIIAAFFALLLCFKITAAGPVSVLDFFYADALSAFFLLLISISSVSSAFYSKWYFKDEENAGFYNMLFNIFVFSMYLVVTVNNLGMLWVSVEITTLASAFLVGYRNNKTSVEAAWKYIIICSVGITLALFGIILLSSTATADAGIKSLNWTELSAQRSMFNPRVVKAAFIFIVVGFGTKAGLAPMHNWLPDAHSQAPSPISALLSGVLLKASIYAIIRFLIIAAGSVGYSFCGNILGLFGLSSLGIAAFFILVQKDLKRLLAYSSVEHVGLISVGFYFGGKIGIFGALFHALNHSLAKGLMFFSSGNIIKKYGTNNINQIKGALETVPLAATAAFIGMFALAGMPPFSIFMSELTILMAGFKGGYYYSSSAVLLFLSITFGALVYQFGGMLYGKRPANLEKTKEPLDISILFAVIIVVMLIFGLHLPEFVKTVISSAADVVLGAGL